MEPWSTTKQNSRATFLHHQHWQEPILKDERDPLQYSISYSKPHEMFQKDAMINGTENYWENHMMYFPIPCLPLFIKYEWLFQDNVVLWIQTERGPDN